MKNCRGCGSGHGLRYDTFTTFTRNDRGKSQNTCQNSQSLGQDSNPSPHQTQNRHAAYLTQHSVVMVERGLANYTY